MVERGEVGHQWYGIRGTVSKENGIFIFKTHSKTSMAIITTLLNKQKHADKI